MSTQSVTTDESGAIACRLPGREFAQRKDAITNELFRHATAIEEQPDGFLFRFPGFEPWAGRIVAFVAEERQCCPFFRFDIGIEPNDGAVTLALSGSSEIKAFVLDELGLAEPG